MKQLSKAVIDRANHLIPFLLDFIGKRRPPLFEGATYMEWDIKTRFSPLRLHWMPLERDSLHSVHITGRFEDVEAAKQAKEVHHICLNPYSGKYNDFIKAGSVSEFEEDLLLYLDHIVDMVDYTPVSEPVREEGAWFEAKLESLLPPRGSILVNGQPTQLAPFKKTNAKHLGAMCDCEVTSWNGVLYIKAKPKALHTPLNEETLLIKI